MKVNDKKIGSAVWSLVLLGTVGFSVNSMIGRTERKTAEDFLTSENYKIESYEGKAGLFERGRDAYYSDKFNVVSPAGKQKTVIVTRGMLSDVQQIHFVKNK